MSTPDAAAKPEPNALSTFDALDDLFLEVGAGNATAGLEAHRKLFGPPALHAELEAFAAQRDSFKKQFTGPVSSIADFAVTSGHEALASFAGRIAGVARVRRSTIPRVQESLDAARNADDLIGVARHEVDLDRAREDFAKTINSAFNGWMEHRTWIRRSIEHECQAPATRTSRPDDLMPFQGWSAAVAQVRKMIPINEVGNRRETVQASGVHWRDVLAACRELAAAGERVARETSSTGRDMPLRELSAELHKLADGREELRQMADRDPPEAIVAFHTETRTYFGHESMPFPCPVSVGLMDRIALCDLLVQSLADAHAMTTQAQAHGRDAVVAQNRAMQRLGEVRSIHRIDGSVRTDHPDSSEPDNAPDPNVQWVPASSCIDDQRKDATAVRRFCESHNVRTHRPGPRRLLVDWTGYRAAKKAIAKSAERALDGITERQLAERERKRRRLENKA